MTSDPSHRDSNRRSRWLIPLVILLLASLACTLPGIGGLAGTATPAPLATGVAELQATLNATPGGQPVPALTLPPALVEVDPMPRSALPAGSPFTFYFNQAMERPSVEAAFRAEPAISGRFEWSDDATLRFLPEQALSYENGLTLTINSGARAANGMALADPIQVSYAAPGPLQVMEQLPFPGSQDANPSSAVVVTFNQPVVALGDEMAAQPPAFTLDPPAVGRGEWINTSTYIFYPQPALMGGIQYSVRLAPDLASTSGATLPAETPAEWNFTTAAPALIQVQPSTETPLLLDTAFVLTFNQPMDRASVESNFSLVDAAGQPVAGNFTWNDTGSELTFTPGALLQRSARYTLILVGAAASLGGAPIGQDFAAQLVSVVPLSVLQTRPAPGEKLEVAGGYASLMVTLSAPLADDQKLEDLVTISPSIGTTYVSANAEDFRLYISGFFKPSTSYELRISPDLRDPWGGSLGTAYTYTFSTQSARPWLTVPVYQYAGSPVLFLPHNETEVPAQSININRVTFARGRLSLDEFITAAQDYQGLADWQSKVQSTWVRLFYPTANEVETINLPLTQETDQLLPPGLYFWQVDPAIDDENPRAPGLVVVSPIQLTVKTSSRQAFVWAISLNGDAPVTDTLVTFYNETASVLGTCSTDAQGLCMTDIPVNDQYFQPIYAVIGQPGDPNFSLASSTWGASVTSWSFGIPFENKGDRPEFYLYSDRPLYQPGQTVNFRTVVRSQDNGRYARTDLTQLEVEVVGPYDPVTGTDPLLDTVRVPLTVYGAGSAAYQLPDDASLGAYILRVVDQPGTELYFDVAVYRKPEIDLAVSFSKPDQLAGSDLQAQLQASYYFGAPAGNLPVRWALYSSAERMRFPGELSSLTTGKLESWFELSAQPASDLGSFVLEGSAQTRPDGSLVLDIPNDQLKQHLVADRTLRLTLEVTVEDESGLPVSARASARLHPAALYIGVRGESWSVSAGQEITYYIRSLDWQGSPIAGIDLTAHFRKVNWVRDEAQVSETGSLYRPEYADAGSTDFRTSEQGEARLAFVPTEPGTYQLDVTLAGAEADAVSGPVTQDILWVGGAGSNTSWPASANQHLQLRSNAPAYQPDQVARIFVPNPYPQGALALVTVERGRVMRAWVQPISGASAELEVPLMAEDAPNVYVSVLLLGREGGRPDFSMGYLNLPVDAGAFLLDVSVDTSPPQAQPGGSLTLNIRAKDAAGSPVQAEFSLALVDKALLALRDPNSVSIVEAFYGQQPLGVTNGLSLTAYSHRFVPQGLGRGGGGAGDYAVLPLGVRQKFEDTAYWNGVIETDVNGIAQVTVTLPDNLTTWVADVRGLTVDTRVGQATAEATTSKPLLVRPVTPRFAVVGDHFELAAVVHNNTTEPLQAQAALEAIGFTLDNAAAAVQQFELPAGERRRVSWWGTVQDVEALDLLFSTQAGSLNDQARPEIGKIPVLRYSAPQTFGTAGILPSAGQRVEAISLPRSFSPQGGQLRVELAPSLAASILDGLQALEAFPYDFTEPVLSRLLPNVVTYAALKELSLQDEALQSDLETAVQDGLARIVRLQNPDGGWGWAASQESDAYISAYVLFGLGRAKQAGLFQDKELLLRAQDFVTTALSTPTTDNQPWQLDRLAFISYALQSTGRAGLPASVLYEYREKLSPWGKALLALTIAEATPGDPNARGLISDLQGLAVRSATGAHWQDPAASFENWSTPGFTTAVVVYAIARLDPAAEILGDAVRYLVLTRRPNGTWSSSYESAWTLLALVETMRGTGDLQANFDFSASLNGAPLIDGQASTPSSALSPVTAEIGLGDLLPGQPNALVIQRGEGTGRLYYRAYLEVARPAEQAQPIQRGLSITRAYFASSLDCREQACPPLDTLDLASPAPVTVRLTITLPTDTRYLVVEDFFPAGAEVLNPRLKTAQQAFDLYGQELVPEPLYDESDPFARGWGWWFFNDPQVSADRIRWVASFLPAGTYQLTYRVTPYLPGSFHLLPARAWQYYFPEVEGATAGQVLEIK